MTTTVHPPIPDPVDLDRVATFIAEPVFDDLFEVIVRSDEQPRGQAGLSEDASRGVEFSHKPQRNRLRRVLVAAAVVAILAASLAAIVQTRSAQTRPGVTVTSWRAARPVPGSTQSLSGFRTPLF